LRPDADPAGGRIAGNPFERIIGVEAAVTAGRRCVEQHVADRDQRPAHQQHAVTAECTPPSPATPLEIQS
jgi:hypothetical protein